MPSHCSPQSPQLCRGGHLSQGLTSLMGLAGRCSPLCWLLLPTELSFRGGIYLSKPKMKDNGYFRPPCDPLGVRGVLPTESWAGQMRTG